MSPSAVSPGGFVRGAKNEPPARPVNVQVAVRIRPLNARERKQGERSVLQCNESHREIISTASYSGSKRIGAGANANTNVLATSGKKYIFDHVFGPNAGQEQVYETVCEPIVAEVLQGYNCTVFAYGQTGTGKTHTMEGRRDDEIVELEDMRLPENAGIIPRAIKQVFDYLRSINEEYTVRVSHVELYNEQITDLLSTREVDIHEGLRIYEDTQKGTFVQGMEEVVVRSEDEIFAILDKSAVRRRTAETLMNKYSSRSHSVFTVTIHIKESTPDGQDLLKVGKLNLVDLAGSENVGRSGAIKGRAREAGNINQSLLTLGRVITSLVDNHPHVPYRDSKLTRLLQESLGGRNKTCVIATVTPGVSSIEESASTLDYAYRARSIKNRPQINQMITKHALLKEYNEEIVKLKAELHATRSKNGVYLPLEQYELLQNTNTSQEQWIKDLKCRLGEFEKKNSTLKVTLLRTQNALARNQRELETTQEKLGSTRDNLSRTKFELKEMTYARDEANHIIVSHETRGSSLLGEAETLKGTLADSLHDVSALQKRCKVKNELEKTNVRGIDQLRRKLVEGIDLMRTRMSELKEKQQVQFESFRNTSDALTKGQKEHVASSVASVTALLQFLQQTTEDVIAAAEKNNEEAGFQRNELASGIKDGFETNATKLEELKGSLEAELQQIRKHLNKVSDSTLKLHVLANDHAASTLTLSLRHSEEGLKSLDTFNRQVLEQLAQQESLLAAESKETEKSAQENMQAVRKMQNFLTAKISKALADFVNETDTRMGSVMERSKNQAEALTSAISSVRATVSSHRDSAKRQHKNYQIQMEEQQSAFTSSAEKEAQRSSTLVEELACQSEQAVAAHSALIDSTTASAVETAAALERRLDALGVHAQTHIQNQKTILSDTVSNCDKKANDITFTMKTDNEYLMTTIAKLENRAEKQVAGVNEYILKAEKQSREKLSDPLECFELKLDTEAGKAPPSRDWRFPDVLTKLQERTALQGQFRQQHQGEAVDVVDLNKVPCEGSDVTEEIPDKDNERFEELDSDVRDESPPACTETPSAESIGKSQSHPLKDETNTIRTARLPRSATTTKINTDIMKPPSTKFKLVRSQSTQIGRSGLRRPRIRVGKQVS